MTDAGSDGLSVCNTAMNIGSNCGLVCSVLMSARAGRMRVYPKFGLEAGS